MSDDRWARLVLQAKNRLTDHYVVLEPNATEVDLLQAEEEQRTPLPPAARAALAHWNEQGSEFLPAGPSLSAITHEWKAPVEAGERPAEAGCPLDSKIHCL